MSRKIVKQPNGTYLICTEFKTKEFPDQLKPDKDEYLNSDINFSDYIKELESEEK